MPETPAFSEDAIAHCLSRKEGADWLYCADAGTWYRFDEKTGLWRRDVKGGIYHLSRLFCREFGALADKDKASRKFARSLAHARTCHAVVVLLSKEPALVITRDELDANPWLLGTPSGVMDLRSGELLQPDRRHLVTLSTAVTPAPAKAAHPMWTRYLNSTYPAIPGRPEPDAERIEFLQRWHGYSLTGETSEEKFVFEHGTGRNGKGVRLETMVNILGDYAATLPAETLMERAIEPHRAELAVLRDKRFVVADEIPRGRRWNQQRLTQLTGGGRISANLMRENPTDFLFRGKLNIGGNFKPVFPTTNRAIRDRLLFGRHLMEFVSAEEYERRHDHEPTLGLRDNDLKTALHAEYAAILRWAIQGCLLWQADGLRIPASLTSDAADYLSGQDDLGNWMAACCITNPTASVGERVKLLFASWCRWAAESGEAEAGGYQQFRAVLSDRFTVTHRKNGTVALGLSLTDLERARLTKVEDWQTRSDSSDAAFT